MKQTIEDEKVNDENDLSQLAISLFISHQVKDKISGDEAKAINDKCDDTIKWLDANQLAEVDEYTTKQKEGEGVCNPIITKLYGAGGGAPGAGPDMGGMGGGAPSGAGAAGGQGGAGPTIEEVD